MRASRCWYDHSSKVYDWTLDIPYWSVRKAALKQLNLSANDTVLDIGCGTGVNFKPILKLSGHKVNLYGIDPSYGMLSKAKQKINRYRKNNIQLIQSSLESIALSPEMCGAATKVIMCLSLSVVADWQAAFMRLFKMLPADSRIVIMDIFHRNGAFGGSFLDSLAASDTTRPIWQGLEDNCPDFHKQDFRPFKIFDVSMFVASGTKI